MDQKTIRATAQAQLSIDLNCTIDDLSGKKDGLLFVNAKTNAGRRPFPRSKHHFEMASMGSSVVVSATPEILQIAKPLLEGKDRDSAFLMPFVCGQSLYYLPELRRLSALCAPIGFTYELIEQANIPQLYTIPNFRHAIQYDISHPRPDILTLVAKHNDTVVGMAGASNDCAKMWQIGIDVLPEFRGNGLAVYLSSVLTQEILRRGMVPYYGTASSNIASQRIAHKVGYAPAWVCCYQGRFEGYDLLPTS